MSPGRGPHHPLHRRDPHHGRRRQGGGRHRRRQHAEAARWRAASCTASAPPRSTNTASTSRRMPRWSAASRKVLWSMSRRSSDHRHPARPAGEVRTAPRRRHHRPGHRRRGRAVAPLHHRPLPAGQGDRPDRRGGARIKMEIDSKPEVDGQARPPHHPAEDRARGGEEGEGRGLGQKRSA